jgi:sialic acid synthase SpsE
VGYSDHALGNGAALNAVAVGARIIEKHFTLDHNYSGFRDHALSADPTEFAKLRTELTELESMLGSGEKAPAESEREARQQIRRSVKTRRALLEGDRVASDDVICQRPETGVGAWSASAVVGRRVVHAIPPGTPLQLDDLSQQENSLCVE